MKLPRVVQAPMANNQPVGLAAAASNAGALGMVAGAALSPDELRAAIRETRAQTQAPFGANLFAPPYLNEDSLAVVLEERPAVFSFAFGVIDPAPLQEVGITVVGTATSALEASVLRQAGVDAVCAQGAEAGGHRGSFLDNAFPLIPVAELVRSIEDVPVIAAGGIVDRNDVRAMRELGAVAVQVGTAFLFTHACGRPPSHLKALRTYDTVVTAAYTGRPMRAAADPVLQELMTRLPLPFPEQRRESAKLGPLYMGGTGARRCREQSVAELVAELCA